MCMWPLMGSLGGCWCGFWGELGYVPPYEQDSQNAKHMAVSII